MHFRILDHLPYLFQYFMMSLKGYLETNWRWYRNTCRNLLNEQDSKSYTPGFIFVVLVLYNFWHSDLSFWMMSSRCVLILYIYFIIQFRQHNIKVKVTATCFDLRSHLQAYLRIITNYNILVHIWDPRWLTMCVGIRI